MPGLRSAVLLGLFALGHSFSISVSPGKEECFAQNLEPQHIPDGQHLPISFEGHVLIQLKTKLPESASIEVKVTGVHDELLAQKVVEGAVLAKQDISFTASGFGTYVTCLLNRAPHDTASVAIESFAPYKLMKDPASLLPRLTAPTFDDAKDAGTATDLGLAGGILQTGDYHLRLIIEDLNHLKARQLRHQETIKSTERRTMVWAGIELVVIVFASGVQMALLHFAFRKK